MFTFNKPALKHRRKSLRNKATRAEQLLWKQLKGKRILGYKFIRQYSVDNFILDFYCPKFRLGIELDGSHHAEHNVAEYDKIRIKHITLYQIKILRFWNADIKYRMHDVLETIITEIQQHRRSDHHANMPKAVVEGRQGRSELDFLVQN